MSTQLQTRESYALTAPDTDRAYRVARIVLSCLNNLFERDNPGGFAFQRIICIGPNWLTLDMDCKRLYHTRTSDLRAKSVTRTLADCVRYPVLVDEHLTGMIYFVRVGGPLPEKPAPAPLPRRVDLDIAQRPAGEYVVGFGESRNGPVWRELSRLTHIIVAGSSDSGKSAFLRSLVYQLARQPLPVELYLADMEGLTFAWAENWPMLKAPIAGDLGAATKVTERLIAEVDRRAQLYFTTGKFPESLDEYHKAGGERLPWIVAIFDEFSALADEAGKGSVFVHNISQLAMRARKFGVTLVFAGQDFKADLLNTRITNQLKTRVQFRCARRQQSEVVLGQGGAENITVPGRALVQLDGGVIELQAYWLDKGRVIVSGDTVAASGPRLSEAEAALVRYALSEFGGAFPVRRLAASVDGWKANRVEKLARLWEARGWLTPPPSQSEARRVTDMLREMVE